MNQTRGHTHQLMDAEPPQKASPVGAELTRMSESLANQSDLITALESRLDSVLRPANTDPAGDTVKPAPESWLHAELMRKREVVDGANDLLRRILDRLTV